MTRQLKLTRQVHNRSEYTSEQNIAQKAAAIFTSLEAPLTRQDRGFYMVIDFGFCTNQFEDQRH
jgi:hypothetical protein